jgi:hypothetical protein
MRVLMVFMLIIYIFLWSLSVIFHPAVTIAGSYFAIILVGINRMFKL